MNTWDKKASKAAVPELLKASQQAHTAGPPANVADAIAGPFIAAARWQRDQLRTDEAVERVAESLWLTDAPCADNGAVWAEQDYYMKLDYCRSAEAAINALLGEEP